MTSRRSGKRIPPAISVRLTTLMAKGPEDCRACTSQSRAAAQVHPRVRPVPPPGLTQAGGPFRCRELLLDEYVRYELDCYEHVR